MVCDIRMTKKKKIILFLIIGIVVSQILFVGFLFYSIWNKFQTESPDTNDQLIIEIEKKTEEFIINNYGLQKTDFKIDDVSYRSEFLNYSANRWRYYVKVKLNDARINYFNVNFNLEKEVDDSNYLLKMSNSYVDEYMENLRPIEDYLSTLGFYTREIIDDESNYFMEMNLNRGGLWEDITEKILQKETIHFDELLKAYPKDVDLYIDLYTKEDLPYSTQDIKTKLKENFLVIDQTYHLRITKVGITDDGSMNTIGGYGKYDTFYLD